MNNPLAGPGPLASGRIRYLIALAMVLLATSLRGLADPALGLQEAYSPYLLVTILAAWTLGRGPALFCMGLGFVLAGWSVAPPRGARFPGDVADLIAAGVYILESLIVVAACHHLRTLWRERETRARTATSNADNVAREEAARKAADVAMARKQAEPAHLGPDIEHRPEHPVPRGTLRETAVFDPSAERLFVTPRSGTVRSLAPIAITPEQHALHRAAEAVFQEQEALLGATLDVLVDPVVYVDRSGLVRFANSAAVNLLGDGLIGVTPDAWTAQLPVDFLGGPGTLDSLRGALASGRTVRNRRVEFVDAVGAPRVALASIVPVMLEDTIQGAVVYMHDVTQELMLAAELENANMELRTRFEELLAQQEVLAAQSEEVARQRAQLADRNADLTSASRLKSEVLATMSHELRTPLNAVIGFAEVLLCDKTSPLGEAHRPYVHDIRAAGEQLLLLINDVLDLSRIEAGRLQIRTERMDIAVPMLQARDLTSTSANERSVTVVSEIAPGRIFVDADPDRVRQIVLNLLSNALKFTPSGGTVTLRAVEGPGGIVRASVTDTGIGIDGNDVHKLFQPFTQLDNGLTRRHGGTGLGLAISKQLAEAMNGTIGCESVSGRGSTFFFTLPLAAAAEAGTTAEADVAPGGEETPRVDPALACVWGPQQALAAPVFAPQLAAPVVAPAPIAGRGPRLHVLIVDDNAVNRRVLRSMLAPTGCDLTEASDGSTGIQLARDLRPGVILMDLQMPEMDGLTATRILAADPATASIPVIAITAHAMLGDADRAVEAGCVGYLAKPVGRENLMHTIDRATGSGAWRS